jgi:hypothetical protein
LNEEERKKRRVERLKQLGVVNGFDTNVFKDPSVSDWEKLA